MKYFKYLFFLLPFLASNVKGAQAVAEANIVGEIIVHPVDYNKKEIKGLRDLKFSYTEKTIENLFCITSENIEDSFKKMGYHVEQIYAMGGKIFWSTDSRYVKQDESFKKRNKKRTHLESWLNIKSTYGSLKNRDFFFQEKDFLHFFIVVDSNDEFRFNSDSIFQTKP